MEDSRPVSIAMAIGHKLSKNNDTTYVNKTLYRSMIGKLQYVVQNIPGIALVVGIVARFFTSPKENHMMDVKRRLRYLKGTKDYGLYYKKNDKFELKFYIDVDWVENVDGRKNTSSGAFFLGKRLVSWTRKKENYYSESTTKVEYVAAIVNC